MVMSENLFLGAQDLRLGLMSTFQQGNDQKAYQQVNKEVASVKVLEWARSRLWI